MRFERNRQDVGRIAQLGDKFSGIGGVDQYTTLLLHFDKDIKDESLNPHTLNYVRGFPTAAQSVFGGRSMQFQSGNLCYLAFNGDAGLNFSGDFTVDFRIRLTTLPTGTNARFMICGHNISVSYYTYISLRNNGSNVYAWEVTGVANGTATGTTFTASPGVVINQWYHVALVRNGNNFLPFQDGGLLGTCVDADPMPDTSAATFYIGQYGAGSNFLNGYLDEFRVSNGIARWTGDFTPPDRPYSRRNWE